MSQLFFATSEPLGRKYAAQLKKGELKRIFKGIYTDAPYDEIEKLVLNKWHEVVNYVTPTAIAAYRTAHELTPFDDSVFVTDNVTKRRKIVVASILTIHILPGSVDELTEPFLPHLHRSSPARQFLENLSESRGKLKKALGQSWVEERLCIALRRTHGEEEINEIRDTAKTFAEKHGFDKEFNKLNNIISALLSTHPTEGTLETDIGIASARKEPFDSGRITLFKELASYLNRCELPPIHYEYNKLGWNHFAFFESYFSNYIEGTEFEIDEAERIVFEGKNIKNRHQDSHDVSSVYRQVSDYQEMSIVPESANELIEELQRRHFDMLIERPDKNPGLFKSKHNKAGNSSFVSPDDILGTLTQAFTLYQAVEKGLKSAIFMQFVISECQPFDDGNGRLSRIMMNAELHAAEQQKIIVPTVHRESYINGLRQATRKGDFRILVKVLYQLQKYSASIDWADYGEARDTLEEHMAHLTPDEGIATFNRQIRKYKFTPPIQSSIKF